LQVPPAQTSPAFGQVPPLQQGWFCPPQSTHDPALHTESPLHAPPRQHGSPRSPHALHLPSAPQAKPSPHRLSSQQGSPAPPQASHFALPLHTSPSPHSSPLFRQTRPFGSRVSQQPVLQTSPGQQSWPSPPHPAQCPSVQRSPV
jgi:hypothetical protein